MAALELELLRSSFEGDFTISPPTEDLVICAQGTHCRPQSEAAAHRLPLESGSVFKILVLGRPMRNCRLVGGNRRHLTPPRKFPGALTNKLHIYENMRPADSRQDGGRSDPNRAALPRASLPARYQSSGRHHALSALRLQKIRTPQKQSRRDFMISHVFDRWPSGRTPSAAVPSRTVTGYSWSARTGLSTPRGPDLIL
ncbi:unnamed protein product [Macrosiphum euphorbiae]|uniref:Uncharacterized protein n=1 Tax=Macrosiphum euphorbiae TaxID=13131 RepID=A0AAV0XU94_9HEMI|nr:unnamed protein product [Macrosiphum euphorbiae]